MPARHVSVRVQALPSLHDVPSVMLERAVVLLLGWHDWQWFCGFGAFGA
jgi:hypothetical protein